MTVSPMLVNGVSPNIKNATEKLVSELREAADKAAENGVPLGLVIGAIELVKIEVINNV